MKLSDFTKIADQLKTIQGVERDLIKRKHAGTIGWVVALVGAIYQAIIP